MAEDYLSAFNKQFYGLKYLYEKSVSNFYFFIGTDTYFRVEKLLTYLNTLDSNKNLYIGGHGWINNELGSHIYYHSGGCGFILSRALLEKLVQYIDFIVSDWPKLVGNSHLLPACDLAIAYYFRSLDLLRETIICDNFYACNHKGKLKGSNCCKNIDWNKMLVCHFMELEDMREIHNYYLNLEMVSNNLVKKNFQNAA